MPIDYQNDLGVTLLHVAAQNGNKRIAKLCLRKGADVNKRNNNGQVRIRNVPFKNQQCLVPFLKCFVLYCCSVYVYGFGLYACFWGWTGYRS